MKIITKPITTDASHLIPEVAIDLFKQVMPESTILCCDTKVSGECKKSINGNATLILTLDNYRYRLEVDISGCTVKDLADVTVLKEYSVLSQAWIRKACAEQGRNIMLDMDPKPVEDKEADTKGRAWYQCQKVLRLTHKELVPDSTSRVKQDTRLTALYSIFKDHDKVQNFLNKYNGDVDAALAAISALLG